MPRRKPHEERAFKVRGAWPFPFDMLRYDHCYPATSFDANIIENMQFETTSMGVVQIELRTRSEFGPTPARWKSFTWEVLE